MPDKVSPKDHSVRYRGDSLTLLHNMRELQIDPRELDIVVLSHIHGDHVGVLQGFLEQNGAVTVCLPQSFSQSFKDEAKSSGTKVEEVY
jgi:7,8-dihydropterin-6-yl-methyl-4-(beta-D-ribofuranosyl)aminobenzene 5'-phosphate synthase